MILDAPMGMVTSDKLGQLASQRGDIGTPHVTLKAGHHFPEGAPWQALIVGAQNMWAFRTTDHLADQEFLEELLSRAQTGVVDLDIPIRIVVAHFKATQMHNASRDNTRPANQFKQQQAVDQGSRARQPSLGVQQHDNKQDRRKSRHPHADLLDRIPAEKPHHREIQPQINERQPDIVGDLFRTLP